MSKISCYFVVLIVSFNPWLSGAQTSLKDTSLVTSYLHIFSEKPKVWPSKGIVGFILKNIDSSGSVDWQSGNITTFYNEGPENSDKFFIKVNLPSYLLKGSKKFWCTSLNLSASGDTIRYSYGGVRLSDIKLFLKSQPEGAEAFLIPNRIWQNKIEGTNWQKNNSIIENYRVNTSITNTFAVVDQTVFVVLFKLKDKFKKIVHFTKPANVEQEQTVWVEF